MNTHEDEDQRMLKDLIVRLGDETKDKIIFLGTHEGAIDSAVMKLVSRGIDKDRARGMIEEVIVAYPRPHVAPSMAVIGALHTDATPVYQLPTGPEPPQKGNFRRKFGGVDGNLSRKNNRR